LSGTNRAFITAVKHLAFAIMSLPAGWVSRVEFGHMQHYALALNNVISEPNREVGGALDVSSQLYAPITFTLEAAP
jgi:hypothetical protein